MTEHEDLVRQVAEAIVATERDLDELIEIMSRRKYSTREELIKELVTVLSERVDHDRVTSLAAVAVSRLVPQATASRP